MLDIKKARRISPDEIHADFSGVRDVYDGLAEAIGEPPLEEYDPPLSLDGMTDSELNQAILDAALMYGHYAKVEKKVAALLKGAKRALKTLEATLRTQVYPMVPKEQLNDTILQDKAVKEANVLIEEMEYLLGDAGGEKSNWHSLRDAYSRAVELRREARFGGRTPKKPRAPGKGRPRRNDG